MNTNKPLQNILSGWSPFVVIAATTLAAIAISIYCLLSGWVIIFQNLFYVPIIIACMYYTKKGFAFSVVLSFIYLFLIISFTRDSIIIMEALIRVFVFVGIAGLTAFLSIKRKRTKESLRESQEQYRALVENAAIGITVIDTNYKIIMVNAMLAKLFNKPVSDFVGKNCFMEYEKREAVCPHCPGVRAMASGNTVEVETQGVRDNGSRFNVRNRAVPFVGLNGVVKGFIELVEDITESKKNSEQIQKNLKEKEVLLQEIHHRVKNNMQVISSLLRLQSRNIKDEKSVEIFRECQNRVKSMALIHTKLYQSESLASINFAEYVSELTRNLMDSYNIDPGKVALTINVEKISLGVDLAVPCGLLVNELISNSLKHAFPKEASGEIKIYMHPTENSHIELTVSDNGIGFPEDLDFRKTDSLGIQLIISLAEGQLQGKIELNRSAGTEFKVTFNDLLNGKNKQSKDKHSAESVCTTSA